ncbi:TetR/AcrR family transcriptional regulator [Streptosporangium sp. CA-135522]|uniref:TetR/AcrR family transcriptional regulator n=1 Tax=Streptosporangium sp. CA-135522 TaxID=3240072 RepID=UPI003D8FB73C
MTSAEGGQREMILQVATRLFAALGYDVTSIGQIADATGLDVATVTESFGGKRELYLAVMNRVYEIERSSLAEALKIGPATTPEQTSALMHRIVDHYIDLCAAYPEVPTLWMHRWLSDAIDVTELERRYTQPLVKLIRDAFAPAMSAGHIGPDVDLDYVMWSLLWCVNGFSQSGTLDQDGNRRRADDPEALRRLRVHLHRMIHRAASLPGEFP